MCICVCTCVHVCMCNNSHTFLVGSQTKDAVLRSNLALFSQINICIIPGCIFFQNSHICLVGNMYKNFHGNIDNCGRKFITIWKSTTDALEGKGGQCTPRKTMDNWK